MKKLILFIGMMLILSSFALGALEQVVIAVEGTAKTTDGTPTTQEVSVGVAVGTSIEGLESQTPSTDGFFSVLVGSTNELNLQCGESYDLVISIAGEEVGRYNFVACHGTSSNLVVPGNLAVTGTSLLKSSLSVTGATTLSSSLNVAGTTTLTGDITLGGKLNLKCKTQGCGATTVEVSGGRSWGSWQSNTYCSAGYYVCGLAQRVESDQGDEKDDTAVNDIRLLCCPF